MSTESNKARAIFLQAIEQPPDQRAALLDDACDGDPELRERVERLLRSHEQLGSFHDAALNPALTLVQPVTEKPGTQIGPYKLLQQIGEGGMGVVYMAEQTEPVERRVALKIIKPGMDTRQVIARFEAERQALAMMDHPNIARVLDAGQTDTGRPYFVMELVKGVPITQYCDEQQLTLRQRLELFLPICQAIQHAHQKGVIHRDIKPSNVLVALFDGQPVPKVIDFGIAKATGGRLTEKTLFTQYGQIVGTLEYMSPEQAQLNQLDIDTRSDVYSLGVLLYELLTGATPFDKQSWREAGFDEIRRIIREDDPPRPSDRVSTLAAEALSTVSKRRRSAPRQLSFGLRGELDWIVMKALEKDRGRRYETASAFAADVQRYLYDAPVLACPPSLAYRFKKLARRNKVALSLSSFAAVSLLALTVGALSYAFSVQRESQQRIDVNRKIGDAIAELHQFEDRAQSGALDDKDAWFVATRAIQRAETLAKSDLVDPDLLMELSEAVADFKASGVDRKLVLQLDAIRDQFGGDAARGGQAWAVKGRQMTTPKYGTVFADYGLPPVKMEPAEAAKQIADKPPRVREALTIALWVWSGYDSYASANLSDEEKAEHDWVRQVLDGLERDPWRHRLLKALREMPVLIDLADDEAAQRRQPPHVLLVLATKFFGPGAEYHDRGIEVLKRAQRQYPTDYWINRKLGDNIRWPVQALRYASIAAALRPKDPEPLLRVGRLLEAVRKPDDALAVYEDALRLGRDPAVVHRRIGDLWARQRDIDAAIEAYRAAVAVTSLPDWHSIDGTGAYGDLRIALKRAGRIDELRVFLEQAVSQHSDNVTLLCWLGDLYYQHGNWSKAADTLLTVYEINAGALNVDRRIMLADALVRTERSDRAKEVYRQVVADGAFYLSGYANLELEWGRRGRETASVEVLQRAETLIGDEPQVKLALGVSLFKNNRKQEAIEAFRQAVSLDKHYLAASYNLAQALASEGRHEEAIEQYLRAIKLNPDCSSLWLDYGKTLQAANRHQEAIVALERAVKVAETRFRRSERERAAHPEVNLKELPRPDWFYPLPGWWVTEALDRLVESHLALGREQDAIATRLRWLEFAKTSGGLVAGGIVRGMPARGGRQGQALAHYLLADLYCQLGQYAPAQAYYRNAIELNPMLINGHYRYALVNLQLQDEASYRQSCRTILKYFGDNNDPRGADMTAWTCTLAPDAVEDYARVLALAGRAVDSQPNPDEKSQLTLGAALFRAGRHEDAIERLTELEDRQEAEHPAHVSPAYACYFLAMAHKKEGNDEQARQYLDKANRWTDEMLSPPFIRRIALGLLRKEAESLLEANQQETDDDDSNLRRMPNAENEAEHAETPS